MGKKHEKWLDFDRYFDIHFNVLKKFDWLIESGDRLYKTGQDFNKYFAKEVNLQAVFKSTNKYQVKISKTAKINTESNRKVAKTTSFSYNCIRLMDAKKLLQYHSPHSIEYKKNNPWHNHSHRHEFIGTTQKIDVYSTDHRPQNEKRNRYYWKEAPINLNFLGHENWPHVHEFLQEVSELPDAG
ncbi:MAG: hypothetical protein OXB88_07210 [Bacteriovoracales bacterium]|nr:hypothetical protein [Bacteriovoracales bacterium]